MHTQNLPTYAIVELLIRLANHNPLIGDYKNHSIHTGGVIVKTTNGSIEFPKTLIMQQFEKPEVISDSSLTEVALLFRASN